MTTIKIKDKKWFRENCVLCIRADILNSPPYYVPAGWPAERAIHCVYFWKNQGMSALMGKVLEVEDEDEDATAMWNSRYMAEGIYIPNWAIEWVKEEVENGI